jgi:lipopolysaccharide biosynthesis regulator YciM
MDTTLTLIVVLLAIVILAGLAFYLYRTRVKNKREFASYTLALEKLLDGEKQAAFDHLKAAIRENTGNIPAYLRLARLLIAHGSQKHALKMLQELSLRRNLQADDRLEIALDLGRAFAAAKKPDQALDYFSSLSAKDYAASGALCRLRFSLFRQAGQYEEAHKWLRQHQDIFTDSATKLAEIKVEQGRKLVAEGAEKDARVTFKDALKHQGNFPAALLEIGDSYWREERFEDALEQWENLCENNPENAHLAFTRLEKAYFDLQEFDRLQGFYLQLSRRHPQLLSPLFALADIYIKKGELQDALAVTDKALDIAPDNISARRKKIELLHQLNDDKKAVTLALDLLRDKHPEGGSSDAS